MTTEIEFLPGVPREHVLSRLQQAGGNEVASGKLVSPESSAALAINCFGWFIERPALLPGLPGLDDVDWPATDVDVEYCARFPWSGGRHPWLDAVVRSQTCLVGVESKRFEPFRDRKVINLSDAYDRPVWGSEMKSFEQMRDDLRSGVQRFHFLDAAQLVKHALGLVTQAGREQRKACLAYVYMEPKFRGASKISNDSILAHRDEISRFACAVQGAAVQFTAFSYATWLSQWVTPDLQQHAVALRSRFDI